MSDDIKLLEQKNKALSHQLDKITNDLFKMQEVASDLKSKLEEKKHSEQLHAWAFDRATEAAKLDTATHHTIMGITADAEHILAWLTKMGEVKS